MTNIHWVGAGLSSGPGITDLATEYGEINVWDLTTGQAEALSEHLPPDARIIARTLDLNDGISVTHFCKNLQKGDVVISMLPAFLHVKMAELALSSGAHLVTSSYLSDDMNALGDTALEKGLCLVNEVGLDPGIDHLFAHILVDEARKAGVMGKGAEIDFVSHCGGVPVEQTDFTYKFSWTPLGVLTALQNEARLIENGKQRRVPKAWEAVSELSIKEEVFEVYPNRDSLPYVEEYGFGDESNLKTFVRGTLRLSGWKVVWKEIFDLVEKGENLKSLSDELWQKYRYDEDEQDRVILYVALKTPDWQASLSLDEVGSGWRSAMASCVSLNVAQAVRAVVEGRIKPGVHACISDATEARRWLKGLEKNGLVIHGENISL